MVVSRKRHTARPTDVREHTDMPSAVNVREHNIVATQPSSAWVGDWGLADGREERIFVQGRHQDPRITVVADLQHVCT